MAKICLHESCNYPVFSNGYCGMHQSLRTDRKWLARLEKQNEKTVSKPIKKQSDKYGKELAIYHKRLPSWKKEHPFCEYPGCKKPTAHCHHTKNRGIYLNDESTFMALCVEHHDICKLSQDKAREMKLIFSRIVSEKKYN